MAHLDTKIKEYAKAKGVTSINFLSDVILEDDGSGAVIKSWNLGIAEPSASDLDAVESEANATEQAEVDAKAQKEADKASAKAKLIAGEALTEAEANTIVL